MKPGATSNAGVRGSFVLNPLTSRSARDEFVKNPRFQERREKLQRSKGLLKTAGGEHSREKGWDTSTHLPGAGEKIRAGEKRQPKSAPRVDHIEATFKNQKTRLMREIYGITFHKTKDGRIDNDGWPKGVASGLPGTREAGQMSYDFKLARYGECPVQNKEPKIMMSARGRLSGDWCHRKRSPEFGEDVPRGGALTSRSERSEGRLPSSDAGIQSWIFSSPRTATSVATPILASFEKVPMPITPLFGPGTGNMSPASVSTFQSFRPMHSRSTARDLATPQHSVPGEEQDALRMIHKKSCTRNLMSPLVKHPRQATYHEKKPASKWNQLGVPEFYLKTLPGCTVGHVPSIYFEKEPSLSTAGHNEVSAFYAKPLSTNPSHYSAAKDYFAPKGFGKYKCEICDRSFLNKELLEQHCNSTFHKYQEASVIGFEKPPRPIPKSYNILDCGEFDEAYYEMNSDSDLDAQEDYSFPSTSRPAELQSQEALTKDNTFTQPMFDKAQKQQERDELRTRLTSKRMFFDFVRTHEDNNVSHLLLHKDPLMQIKDDIDEALDKGHQLRAAELLRLYENQKALQRESAQTSEPTDEDEAEEHSKEKLREMEVKDMRVSYLERCKKLNILPKASLVTRQRNAGFDLSYYGAGNSNVQALAPSLRAMKKLETLSLRDNRIEESGAAEIINAIRDKVDLYSIDLSTNHIGRLGVLTLSRILHTLHALKALDLSKNRLNDHEIIMFMNVIHEAPSLESVILSNNNIASDGGEAIGNALNVCPKLCMLDLSWNALRGKGVSSIGEALVQNSVLTDLKLSWNGLGGSKHFDTWANAFELNTTLLKLDLSHNGLDERNCLIICENLKWNVTIQAVILDDNPLGPIGAKLVFKLMDTFGQDRSLQFNKCNFEVKSKICDFNPSCCAGNFFSLDLSMCYDRSVAQALVRLAGKNISEEWRNPRLEKAQIDVSQYTNRGNFLPREGKLEFTYVQFVKKATKENVINASTFKKLTAMVSASDRSEMDRLDQIYSIADEIDLTCQQLGTMIDEAKPSSRGKIDLILRLFSRIVDRDEFYEIEERLTKEELAKLRVELGPMWSYSDNNPTGHYRLNLDLQFDRQLAARVLTVNNFERQARKDAGLADTSDDGHYMNFRNETYNGEEFKWTGVWRLPESGILEFDYVSTERPRNDSLPLCDEFFFELLYDLSEATSESEKLEELRDRAHEEYFTTEQLRKIVKTFTTPSSRVDAIVMCHRRVIDLENFLKVIMEELRGMGPNGSAWEKMDLSQDDPDVPSIEDDFEINAVLYRLGWLNCWNPLEADVMYRLNLENRDQNIVAQALVEFAVKEPGENWKGEHLNGKEFELPSTWIKEVPKKGFLEVHYYTDHDETGRKRGDNFEVRMKWFKRTLCYTEGMEVVDDKYEGCVGSWSTHRNWHIHKHVPRLYSVVQAAMHVDWVHDQNLRWLNRKGYHMKEQDEPDENASKNEDTLTMICSKTGAILKFKEVLARERDRAIRAGKHPPPLPPPPPPEEGEEEDVTQNGRADEEDEVASEMSILQDAGFDEVTEIAGEEPLRVPSTNNFVRAK